VPASPWIAAAAGLYMRLEADAGAAEKAQGFAQVS
jgi:hypothetical protein